MNQEEYDFAYGPSFIGILLYAGNDVNGNGKYIRLILSNKGHVVDRFEGRANHESLRSVNLLYPNVVFHVQLRVTPAELNSHKPTAKARDDEWRKRMKSSDPFTVETYRTEYNTHA